MWHSWSRAAPEPRQLLVQLLPHGGLLVVLALAELLSYIYIYIVERERVGVRHAGR